MDETLNQMLRKNLKVVEQELLFLPFGLFAAGFTSSIFSCLGSLTPNVISTSSLISFNQFQLGNNFSCEVNTLINSDLGVSIVLVGAGGKEAI